MAEEIQARRLGIELDRLKNMEDETFTITITDLEPEDEGDRQGKLISAKFDHQFVDAEEPTALHFELYIPKRFPFKYPQLNCITSFTKPSICDGRDLLEDMLQQEWHPFVTFVEIIKKLPEYTETLKKREIEDTLFVEQRANFELGQVYEYSSEKPAWKDCCNFYECNELEINEDGGEEPDQDYSECKNEICLTDNAILIFEKCLPGLVQRDAESKDKLKLSTWGMVSSIDSFERNMDPERKDFITLFWTSSLVENAFDEDLDDDSIIQQLEGREVPNQFYQTRLHVKESDLFIAKLIENMNLMKEKLKSIAKKKIPDTEVSLSTVRKKDITAILHKITVFEQEFAEKKTKEYGQDLMALYQRAIEYYSALGHPEYRAYLEKMTELMNDSEFQKLLGAEV